jgi:multidrug efflux pump subunit AcrA (membrane-fusion protein)
MEPTAPALIERQVEFARRNLERALVEAEAAKKAMDGQEGQALENARIRAQEAAAKVEELKKVLAQLEASYKEGSQGSVSEGTSDLGVTLRTGSAQTFIGGGCCVHLSVEYMPLSPLGIEIDLQKKAAVAQLAASVTVTVADSEGTQLTWKQTTGTNSVYQVRENIMTSKPGARLTVTVENMVARVRWCEVFSC